MVDPPFVPDIDVEGDELERLPATGSGSVTSRE